MFAGEPIDAQEKGRGVAAVALAGPGWNTSHGSGSTARGFAYSARGELSFGSRVGLGFEIARWWTSLGSDTNATNMMLIGTIRPTSHTLYVKGGVGTARATLRSASTEGLVLRRGISFSLGTAFDVPIRAPVYVETSLDMVVQKFSRFRRLATTNSFLAVSVGLAIRKRPSD
jgi:hypothetical protein